MSVHVWYLKSCEEKEMQKKAAGRDWSSRKAFLLFLFILSPMQYPSCALSHSLYECRHQLCSLDRSCLRLTIHDLPHAESGVLKWERKCAEAQWKVWGGAEGRSRLNESHTQYEMPCRISSISYQCCISTEWVCTIPPEKYSHSSAVPVNNYCEQGEITHLSFP